MRDLLGGKGAGLAEMTNAGLPVPPGFTITTEACSAFYANGEKFPAGMWEQALAALRTVEERDRQEAGRPGQPAAGVGALGRQVLHAGHDGHGAQPRPERRDAARAGQADRQRALRLRRLPPLHPAVRQHRAWASKPTRSSNMLDGMKKHERGAKLDTDLTADDLQDAGRAVQGAGQARRPGNDFPDDPLRAAAAGNRGGLRFVEHQAARIRLPQRCRRSRTTWAPPSTW